MTRCHLSSCKWIVKKTCRLVGEIMTNIWYLLPFKCKICPIIFDMFLNLNYCLINVSSHGYSTLSFVVGGYSDIYDLVAKIYVSSRRQMCVIVE